MIQDFHEILKSATTQGFLVFVAYWLLLSISLVFVYKTVYVICATITAVVQLIIIKKPFKQIQDEPDSTIR